MSQTQERKFIIMTREQLSTSLKGLKKLKAEGSRSWMPRIQDGPIMRKLDPQSRKALKGAKLTLRLGITEQLRQNIKDPRELDRALDYLDRELSKI